MQSFGAMLPPPTAIHPSLNAATTAGLGTTVGTFSASGGVKMEGPGAALPPRQGTHDYYGQGAAAAYPPRPDPQFSYYPRGMPPPPGGAPFEYPPGVLGQPHPSAPPPGAPGSGEGAYPKVSG